MLQDKQYAVKFYNQTKKAGEKLLVKKKIFADAFKAGYVMVYTLPFQI